MTNLNNGDLYNMLLDRIRKDQKGSVSPEEFESFLRWRSLDHFSKKLGTEGADKLSQEALSPFLVYHEPAILQLTKSTYYVNLNTIPSGTTTTTTDEATAYLEYKFAVLVNAWLTSSLSNFRVLTKIDLVSSSELLDRFNNAITGPTTAYPIGYVDKDRLWIFGPNSGWVLLDYYRYPLSEYFDYYTDANANITYLTDGQSSYTLQANEVARDGTTAGGSVTSASVDTEWDDDDALQILDMIVSDVSIALSDPESFQASILERKDNV